MATFFFIIKPQALLDHKSYFEKSTQFQSLK
jgi:hypothetical protein